MSTTADSTRHLGTVWRGSQAWEWKALYRGHAQPRGYRTFWRSSHFWQLHLTPLHMGRDGQTREFGLCFGKRTIYLLSHR